MAGDAPTPYISDWPASSASSRPVSLEDVDVRGSLGGYVDRNLESLLYAEHTILFDGFASKASGRTPELRAMRLAADSDVYKWLEGASYAYAKTGDERLGRLIRSVSALILSCQSDDGSIGTQVPPRARFDTDVHHDLYVAGNFFESAVAHSRATGERGLLDAACRWADYLIAEYEKSHSYYRAVGAHEHSEYDLGLLRLSRETGERKYLDFSIDLARMCTVGPKVSDVRAGEGALHAVRFSYLMAGLADQYLETDDSSLFGSLPGIWQELIDTRSYVTGAVGSHGEMISRVAYELPHRQEDLHRTMGETCSSIAMILFSWRMFSVTSDSRVFDAIERTLLNHVLSSVAIDGMGCFYYNPMRMVGDLTGKSDHWHVPANTRGMLPEINKTFSCMPHIWRFVAALPEYVFSITRGELFVNLYTNSTVRVDSVDGKEMGFVVDTEYPHDGRIKIRCASGAGELSLRVRIPAWCEAAIVDLNGSVTTPASGSFHENRRTWTAGETVRLTLPMHVRMIEPDPRVEANRMQVVIARGPLVHCLESIDVDFPVEKARISCQADNIVELSQAAWRGEVCT